MHSGGRGTRYPKRATRVGIRVKEPRGRQALRSSATTDTSMMILETCVNPIGKVLSMRSGRRWCGRDAQVCRGLPVDAEGFVVPINRGPNYGFAAHAWAAD